MMFAPRIKLDKDLYERMRKLAEARGYASVEECVRHLLEQAAAEGAGEVAERTVRERLRGLGYL